jgi:hypothetical protein
VAAIATWIFSKKFFENNYLDMDLPAKIAEYETMAKLNALENMYILCVAEQRRAYD